MLFNPVYTALSWAGIRDGGMSNNTLGLVNTLSTVLEPALARRLGRI